MPNTTKDVQERLRIFGLVYYHTIWIATPSVEISVIWFFDHVFSKIFGKKFGGSCLPLRQRQQRTSKRTEKPWDSQDQ